MIDFIIIKFKMHIDDIIESKSVIINSHICHHVKLKYFKGLGLFHIPGTTHFHISGKIHNMIFECYINLSPDGKGKIENPKIEDIQKGYQYYKNCNCECYDIYAKQYINKYDWLYILSKEVLPHSDIHFYFWQLFKML